MAHGSSQQHLDLLFHACLLALSHSGRHESTTVCTLLLCAGPIEGCSAVRAVRRYYVAFGASFVLLGVQKKTKTSLFVFLGGHIASRADDTASIVSKKSTSPAVMFTSRLVLPSAMTWTEERLCRELATLIQTHTRASCCLLLLWYCCIAVGSGAATTAACIALSSLLTCNEKTK